MDLNTAAAAGAAGLAAGMGLMMACGAKMTAPSKLELKYFDGRGLMEVPRQLLATAGKFAPEDFTDTRYPIAVVDAAKFKFDTKVRP
jgi:hypothetical protein